MAKPHLKCSVCGLINVRSFYKSSGSFSMTSDLRIWPSSIEVFQCNHCGHIFKDQKRTLKEVTKLYKSYQLFGESEEQDQAIFISNIPKSRSQIIIEAIPNLVRLSDSGKFLDIGCNKGILLREFSKNFPGWTVYGHEISPRYASFVRSIPHLGRFYWGDLKKIKEKFALITLIHTLEHVPNPDRFLKEVKRLLAPDGLLLVQVPNCSQNAFDVLVFEHISHFFPETLQGIFINSGFEVVAQSQEIVPKELTFIGRKSESWYKGTVNFAPFLTKRAEKNTRILNKYLKMVGSVQAKNPLVIFGTAQVGTLTAGLLEGKFDFFVDESPWRIGKDHLGHAIKHPRVIKPGDNVILAMAPILAKRVFGKWKHTKANFYYL